MEKSEIKTRLVEENNTIYEIDLDCLKRKEQRKKEKKESETNQIKTKIWLQLEEIGGFCKAYRIEKGVTTNQ